MKAQVAIEFLTAYGWALLAVIVAAVAAFYFLSATQSIPPECNFGNSFQCTTYQFIKNNDGTMKLTFQMTNSLGKNIMLYDRKQIIQVQNIGKTGTNNYTGKCAGPADIVNNGDDIICVFNITDKDTAPSVGGLAKFTVLLNYTNCDVSPIPRLCINGTNRSLQGQIISTLELAPSVVTPRCKDGMCDAGENYVNCPWDCRPPPPATVTVKSTSDCAHTTPLGGIIEINVTVKDQYSNNLPNIPVLLYLVDSAGGVVEHITSYTIYPSLPITDANGLARANLTVNSCNCCVPSCLMLFDIGAIAGEATGKDPHCSYISPLPSQCC